MRKILIIARREYLAMVGSKAFLISMALMPVLMMGGMVAPVLLERGESSDKRIVVLDGTGQLFGPLELAAEVYNLQQGTTTDGDDDDDNGAAILLERGEETEVDDSVRLKYSRQVREGEIHAFVVIPAGILDLPDGEDVPQIVFCAENPVLSEARGWVEGTVTGLVQQHRLAAAGIDPEVVARSSQVPIRTRRPYQADASGVAVREDGESESELLAIFLPLGVMMFMFMIVIMSAQPMLESVLEEKTMRIAEVLLGSATPVQIMGGKLLGNVGGSLTIVSLYVVGAIAVAASRDLTHLLPLKLLPWFVVFLLLAVTLFSSIFLSVGAAVNHYKEAQSLLMPAWILIVLPMFVWLNVVRDPLGPMATTLSLIPPFIPMVMSLRLAASEAVPWWQPALGVVILIAATGLGVFAAGRIFRIGILAQGKAPKITELVRWAVRG